MENVAVTASPLPNPAFWAGKRVLLTGHTGFKGSWAALWLKKLGAQVTGFALPSDSEPALFSLARVESDLVSIIGDLRDRDGIRQAVAAAEPHIVLHMAAQPITRQAIAEPVETMASNVMGTTHLLDALREAKGLTGILIVTSDKVYANDEQGRAFTENDALGGKDPYSASKAATEIVARAFADTYFTKQGVKLVTARGGNVIGGGDYAADRIVPDIVRAVTKGETPVLRMPHATRPWQHVLDCLAGYLLFAEAIHARNDLPRALNFGPDPDHPITVGALAETLLTALGKTSAYDHRPDPGSVEMKSLAVDASRARALLSWRDRLSGEKAIRWTADWYGALHNTNDARALTLSQIDSYCTLP
jgi:CDP-glucose 4,6-dehydratase